VPSPLLDDSIPRPSSITEIRALARRYALAVPRPTFARAWRIALESASRTTWKHSCCTGREISFSWSTPVVNELRADIRRWRGGETRAR